MDNDQEIRGTILNRKPTCRQFSPLLVAMVGLPGRGKSLLSKRLARYLNYTGDTAKVIDVSEYRRRLVTTYSHEIYQTENNSGWLIRIESFREALQDAANWLTQPGNNVAILDGPNCTRSQRKEIFNLVQQKLGFRVMFIESVWDDTVTLERNFKEILKYSVDYRDIEPEIALKDLRMKLEHFQAQYETPSVTDLEIQCPIVKLLDGGYGGLVAHGVVGVKETKILQYIAVPRNTQQTLYFSRHGESEFNLLGRIGGDAGLSPRGRLYSEALAKHVKALNLPSLQVWTSTLQRTKATAVGIQAPQQHLPELNEIFSGECENLSYEELQEFYPKELALRDKEKLKYRYPQGESYEDVMRRLTPLLFQMECETNLLTVSHQAVLRCVLGYFLETPPEDIPYLNVPLHTIIKLTLHGYNYTMETIKMPIDCVDTNRVKPNNCSVGRSSDEVLLTVPAHYDTLTNFV